MSFKRVSVSAGTEIKQRAQGLEEDNQLRPAVQQAHPDSQLPSKVRTRMGFSRT